MNNLACRPGAVSWAVLRWDSQIGQLLTSKKVSSSSYCSGCSFLCVAYPKAAAVTLLMEGRDVWGCIGGGVDLSLLLSLPLLSSWCGCFPSTGSGGGLDLNMASCKACSAGKRRIMAPSLWSGWRGWGAEVSGRSWCWMVTSEKGEAIARMILQGEKQQHFIRVPRMWLKPGYYDSVSIQKWLKNMHHQRFWPCVLSTGASWWSWGGPDLEKKVKKTTMPPWRGWSILCTSSLRKLIERCLHIRHW